MPSFILIHPTVWLQYTNVTDGTDRTCGQRTDSIGRTVLQTVAQESCCLQIGSRNDTVCAMIASMTV